MVLTLDDVIAMGDNPFGGAPLEKDGVRLFVSSPGHYTVEGVAEIWQPLVDQVNMTALKNWQVQVETAQRRQERLRQESAPPEVLLEAGLDLGFLIKGGPTVYEIPWFYFTATGRCLTCRGLYVARYPGRTRYCSNRCKRAKRLERMREHMRENRPSRAREEALVISCASCGKEFSPKRKDARFCSATCRKRNQRMLEK